MAPHRWYLRGGAGVAALSSTPDLQYAPPGSTPWSASGPAVSAATGWSFWLTRSRTITWNVELDLSWQFYGSSPPQPDRSFSYRVSFGVVLY